MKILFTLLFAMLSFLIVKGQNWQPLQIPTDQDIWSSSFISDDEGWIGTENDSIAIIFHTVDKGETWNADTIQEATGGISFIDFTSSLTGYAIVNSKVFKTTNGGSSWSQLQMPGTVYANPSFVTDSTGFITGDGLVYKTTDGGNTWDSLFIGTGPSASPFSKLYFQDKLHGAGIQGEDWVWKTVDGGITWQVIADAPLCCEYDGISISPSAKVAYCEDIDGNYSLIKGWYYFQAVTLLTDVKWIDDSHLIAVGESGLIVTTQDGTNWTEEIVSPYETLLVPDGFNTLYVFGSKGIGYRNDEVFTSTPEDNTLELYKLEIFPNPFKELTSIRFSLVNSSPLGIDLFDLQGKKIKTIVEGNFDEGNHQLQFERENLPPGVYMLQLRTNSFLHTKKLVIQ
ncbi:MAG TPA: YCF48-related protein [Chitinophagales bacterium]|nr:YCF48-related protein [Chitinophagales bacterium]